MMTPLTPSFVTQAATLLLKVREEGSRRGSVIEAMLDTAGLPSDARWAAAFVQFVGYWTHFQHGGPGSTWPFPRTGSFDDMVRYAEEREVVRGTPALGDIVVMKHARTGEHLQGGFVVDIHGSGELSDGRKSRFFDVITIEGNTDTRGTLNGKRVCRVWRRVAPAHQDCFIRWVDLDAQAVTGLPWERTEKIMGRVRLARAA